MQAELAFDHRRAGRVVASITARRAARSGALWGLVFGVYVVSSVTNFTTIAKTAAERAQLARSLGANAGMHALLGVARRIDTVAGFTAWRSLGVLALVGAVWGLLAGTRLTRGEEDAGRWEVLLAGQTTRRGAAIQALGWVEELHPSPHRLRSVRPPAGPRPDRGGRRRRDQARRRA
jgi:ABC-2 type transport system permease protein